MSPPRLSLALAVVILGPLPKAAAWNEVGHMTVAKLAYDRLGDRQKLAVDDILREHIHYKMFLSANAPDDLDLKEWAFLRAATWPDWVRPLTPTDTRVDDTGLKVNRFHREPDHFIDLPFVPPADRGTLDEARLQPGEKTALTALQAHTDTLKSAAATKADKAVALCWTLHLIGDIHQPLHCANQFSATFPPAAGRDSGDVGGNLFGLRVGGHPVRLHSYWDELLGAVPGVTHDTPAHQKQVHALVEGNAARLRGPDFAPDKLPELTRATTFDGWARESHAAAVEVAYRDGDQFLQGVRVPFGGTIPADAPPAGRGVRGRGEGDGRAAGRPGRHPAGGSPGGPVSGPVTGLPAAPASRPRPAC